MHSALQQFEEDLHAQACLRTEQLEAFGNIRARVPEFTQLNDPSPDRNVVAGFEQEVNTEVPIKSLWMPRRPVPNRLVEGAVDQSAEAETGPNAVH
jgi:hypothetical protein